MKPGDQHGPYTIERELGSGAMGSVYLATEKRAGKPDRQVAIKMIAFGLLSNEQAVARFDREADILKQLRHPNIVRLYAAGKIKKTPFFAMEYVRGDSLDRVMADRLKKRDAKERASGNVDSDGLFTFEEVIDWGMALCGALQHAHEKGIIHRDLKPSNLMATDEGLLKLTDFGIAKDMDVTALTGANNTIGTAAYMSPEQCKGDRNLTGKSDMYSLGVVFYELVTGSKPFVAESSVDMFVKHVQSRPPRPQLLRPDVPEAFDKLIMDMLKKSPSDRPEPLDAMARLQAIRDELTNPKPPPQEPPKSELVRKKPKKRKKPPFYRQVWFGAVACLIVLAGLSWVFYTVAIAAPSADKLYHRFELEREARPKLEAAERYLKYYGDIDDERTRTVRAAHKELKVAEREGQMLKRHGNENTRNKPEANYIAEAYRLTMAALTAENEGDVSSARSMWQQLADDYAKSPNQDTAMWGWHAEKKLADMATRQAQLAALFKRLDEMRLDEKEVRFEDKTEQRIVDAERLRQLDDLPLARDRWNQVAETLKGDPERRGVFILAKGKARELDGMVKAATLPKRGDLLQMNLAKAKGLLAETVPVRKATGRNILRDLRDLYAAEPEAAMIVSEAKKLLGEG